ncbi:MAG: GMC family oxidoreductase [Gammaproteobacteria bacterium]|nr:GMC family oxidoreductase [Gammaproteobacteria bacterium]
MNILYDAIVVGSGAGGSVVAAELSLRGLNVLLLEKGRELPRDGSTLDPATVITEGRFKSREAWRDGAGRSIVPEEYFNVGGKTKWYGAALARFPADAFGADRDRMHRAWPIGRDDLDPYYERIERTLDVRPFGCEPDLERLIDGMTKRSGWYAEPLPMGIAANIASDAREATHFDGFASVRGMKGDAEERILKPALARPNLTVMQGCPVKDLVGMGAPAPRVIGVRLEDGRSYRSRVVVLCAGALHSPRLLERFIAAQQLFMLPAARHIGRNLKLHLLTAVLAIGTRTITDQLRKTRLLLNDAVPNSSAQPLGFDGPLLATLFPSVVPRPIAHAMARRAYGFFLQTEDGSHPHNRVTAALADDGVPTLDYDARRVPVAEAEHRELVRLLCRALAGARMMPFSKRIGIEGTAHVCGTLVAGEHPDESVVDGYGRVHGVSGVIVADGSVLPRISRVNPALTIYAFALRAAERVAEEFASARREVTGEMVR